MAAPFGPGPDSGPEVMRAAVPDDNPRMSYVLPVTAVLLGPLALALWSHRVAIRPRADGAAPSLFAFTQRTQWAALLALIFWIPLCFGFGGRDAPGFLHEALSRGIARPWAGALCAGPPLLVLAVIGLLSHDIARRAGLTDWPWRAALIDALRLVGGGVVAITLVLAGVGAYVHGDARIGLAAMLGGIVTAGIVGGARRRAAGLTPYAITSGELRDHVFALAAHAGVGLRQLYVVPFRRFRLANAFAVQGRAVMLTDQLIERLDRDEVDAVLMHELAHLSRNDPARIMRALLVAGVAIGVPLSLLGAWTLSIVLPIALIGYYAYRRRIEYAADARALGLGAHPEAMVTGLARLGAMAQVPVRWSAAREWLLTHPSLERRARRLAAAAGADPEALIVLADAPPSGGERWTMPSALTSPAAFNSEFRRAVVGRLSWWVLLATVVAPAGVVAAVIRLEASDLLWTPRVVAFAAAVAAALAARTLTQAFVGHRPMLVLRRKVEPRLRASIPAEADPTQTFFVGLAPGDLPRIYEGFAEWDVGSLAVTTGRCIYSGEAVRFALAPDEVRRLWIDRRLPPWGRMPIVRIHWERANGAGGTFGLVPIGMTNPFAAGAEARRLLTALEAWRAARLEPAAQLPDFPAPPTMEVTGTPPRALVQANAIVMTWLIQIVLAFALGLAFGVPGHPFTLGAFDIALAAVLVQALGVGPFLLYREPARGDAPQPDSRAA